jgi:AraC-like DNA-binding protein
MSQYESQSSVTLTRPAKRIIGPPSPQPRADPARRQFGLRRIAKFAITAEMVFPILREDLAAVHPFLQSLGLTAAFRVRDETIVSGPGQFASGAAPSAIALHPAVPLGRPGIAEIGIFGILSNQELPASPLKMVLEASLSLAARAIAERWFRLQHRSQWVIAAAPVEDPESGFLLALDQRLSLQNADSRAAEWLNRHDPGASALRWEDFFQPITPSPTLRGRADVPLRLTGAVNSQPWIAILTGPDFSSNPASPDALLHARPRIDRLSDLAWNEYEELSQIPSLTPGMRRMIEEFVEAHLDMPLSVERLAQAAGMSSSHFTRAFRNVLHQTPHRYVMWRRLLRAQELIKTSEASLAEVALVTGFSDQSHLCRLFQLHIGETPSRFRRRCR